MSSFNKRVLSVFLTLALMLGLIAFMPAATAATNLDTASA